MKYSFRCLLLAALFLLCTSGISPSLAADESDWPSYNRTLTSERFSPLAQIDRGNVDRLEETCRYDTRVKTSFQTGPVVAGGFLFVTTEFDTIALDPASCEEVWRVHEDYEPASPLNVNRGVAYLDGRLFRGTQDGRVLAYDAKSGERLWARTIADPEKGESIPAAPVAWNGMVFIGNAGGDNYGVKGRIHALDAKTGKEIWNFYLVPKQGEDEQGHPVSGGATWTSYTIDPQQGLLYVPGGNPAPDFVVEMREGDHKLTNSVVVVDARKGTYKRHYNLLQEDFHDWDVSAAPALFTSANGRKMLAAATKDGHLYTFDRTSGKRLYRLPVTTIRNADKPLSVEGTRFCPGTLGGVLWNGPAYSPQTDLIYSGAVDWCTTVRVSDPEKIRSVAPGQPWTGSVDEDDLFGRFDEAWSGWLYARDAESGDVAWRHESAAPIVSGLTPTGGGLLFFGDLDGRLTAVDAEDGKALWHDRLDRPIAGGIVTYTSGGRQYVAVATGLDSPIWPTAKKTAELVVYGLKQR